jgi:hypothetical protein
MARCKDCGIPYGEMGIDLILPDQQWKHVCPDDGILCANCICKRVSKMRGTTVIYAWIDCIEHSVDYTEEYYGE